jgi:hypothetical protein
MQSNNAPGMCLLVPGVGAKEGGPESTQRRLERSVGATPRSGPGGSSPVVSSAKRSRWQPLCQKITCRIGLNGFCKTSRCSAYPEPARTLCARADRLTGGRKARRAPGYRGERALVWITDAGRRVAIRRLNWQNGKKRQPLKLEEPSSLTSIWCKRSL